MLYVGHFYWEGDQPKERWKSHRGGWFSCFVDAESVDEARQKLYDLIDGAATWFGSLAAARKVYCDEII